MIMMMMKRRRGWRRGSYIDFLALLVYVSTAHAIKICPSSVAHQSFVGVIDYLWTCCTDVFQILVAGCEGPYVRTFWNFWRKWLIWKTLHLVQIAAEIFSHWSSQDSFWDFWNFENCNFNFSFLLFLGLDPMRVKSSKGYSSYKSQTKVV